MARENGTRQDTFRITVSVDGVSFGVWDKKTGGELDSDELKYHPGGMAKMQSLGGKQQPANVVVQRLYDRVDDHDRIQTLINAVGRGKVKVHQMPLDIDGNPYGKAITWSGKLKRIGPPDVDSEGNGAALYEMEVSVEGSPASA